MAGIGELAVISPTPLTPYGPLADGTSSTTLSMTGSSAGPGIRYSAKSLGLWSRTG